MKLWIKRVTWLISVFCVIGSLVACIPPGASHFDFETGTFEGFVSDGGAFTVSSDLRYEQLKYHRPNGRYYITSSEESTGELRSPFIRLVKTGYITFLIAGATEETTYVSILDASETEIFRIQNPEYLDVQLPYTFQRIVLDASLFIGQTIRLVVADHSATEKILLDDVEFDFDEPTRTSYLTEANIRMGMDFSDDMTKKADEYIQLNAWRIPPQNRFGFHLTGEIGWVNDPNGFVYFQNRIHLFYQHNPYQITWGPMHWGHVTSTDFIKWEYLPVALAPDQSYDSFGVFSGSAIERDGKLYLVYTSVADGKQTQAIATSEDGVTFTKYSDNPVIAENKLPQNASIADFRDPKVWERDGVVYMIVSNRNATNQYSKLLLYKTTDMTNWTYAGKVFANNSNVQQTLGIMFECPDLISLNGKDIILVSPQTATNHPNGDSNVYIVGNLNYETGALENWEYQSIRQIDYGFDFYAPQTMRMPDGRTVMVAWMQSWNRRPIYAQIGIAGAMTLPRELSLVDGHLYQAPVRELEHYFSHRREVDLIVGPGLTYDSEMTGWRQNIEISFIPGEGKTGVHVFDDGAGNGMKIYYENGLVWVHRYDVTGGQYAAIPMHNERFVEAPLVDGRVKIRIVIDRYSCEVFVADGFGAITATAFPGPEQTNVGFFSEQTVEMNVIRHEIDVR